MEIGRNDPCHCGSGKKYKKCCMGSKVAPVKSNSIHNNISKANEAYFNMLSDIEQERELWYKYSILSQHNPLKGIKEYVLANLRQLIHHMAQPKPNDDYIKLISGRLHRLLSEGEEVYLENITQLMKENNFSEKGLQLALERASQSTIEKELTKMEQKMLSHAVHGVAMEYMLEPTFSYGTVKISLELPYRAIRDGLVPNGLVNCPVLDIDSKDNLLSFSLEKYGAYPKDFNPTSGRSLSYYPNWQERDSTPGSLGEISKWLGLNEATKNTFVLYETKLDAKDEVNYGKLIGNYLKVLEREMERVGSLANQTGQLAKIRQLESQFEVISNLCSQYNEGFFTSLVSNISKDNNRKELDATKLRKLLFDDGFISKLAATLDELSSLLTAQQMTELLLAEVAGVGDSKEKMTAAKLFQYADLRAYWIGLHSQRKERLANEPWHLFHYNVDGLNTFLYTPYAMEIGLKEWLLADIDQLKQVFNHDAPDKFKIEFFIQELTEIASHNTQDDLPALRQLYIKETMEFHQMHYPGLSTKSFLAKQTFQRAASIDENILGLLKYNHILLKELQNSYENIVQGISAQENYNRCLLLLEVIHRLTLDHQSYIVGQLKHPQIEVVIDDEGELIDFSLVEQLFQEGAIKEETRGQYNIVIKKLSELSQALDKGVKDIASKLSHRGRVFFSSAEAIIKHFSINHEAEFDYSSYCIGYLKCLETELNDKFGPILEECVPHIRKPLTIGSFVWAFRSYRKEIQEKINKPIPGDFISQLDYANSVRNPSAHDGIIDAELCRSIRALLLDKGLLEQIYFLSLQHNKAANLSLTSQAALVNNKLNTIRFLSFTAQEVEFDQMGKVVNREGATILQKMLSTFLNTGLWYLGEIKLQCVVEPSLTGKIILKNSCENNKGHQNLCSFTGLLAKDEDALKLLIRANIKGHEYPASIKLVGSENCYQLQPSPEAVLLREQLYRFIYKGMSRTDAWNIYQQTGKKVLESMSFYLRQGDEETFIELLKGTISSAGIWLQFGELMSAVQKLSQAILTYLCYNFGSLSAHEKQILLKCYGYIIERHEQIFNTPPACLYPLVKIFLTGSKVERIELKDTQNSSWQFEFVNN